VQLVDRTISILVLLSKEDYGLSVTEIAEKLDISTSASFRILQSLMKHHFVLQNSETKRYLLGYRALTIGSNISIQNNLTLAVRPFIEELAEKVNETVALCTLDGNHIICLDYVESKNTMQLMVRTGVAMPPLLTSAGKAILAFQSVDKVKEIYEEFIGSESVDVRIKSYQEIMQELKDVVVKGYAISDEELQVGVQGVAYPIFDFSHKVVGSISITALKHKEFMNSNNMHQLKETAEKISSVLGVHDKNNGNS